MLLVSDIIEKDIKFVEDKLAPCLDHTPRHINGWEHLACTKEVNAPLETRIRCKLNKHYSPTKMLMDYLADSVEMEYKTVQDLIAELKAIERNEVVEIITAVYPGMFNLSVHLYFLNSNRSTTHKMMRSYNYVCNKMKDDQDKTKRCSLNEIYIITVTSI